MDQEQISGWLRNSAARELIVVEAARSARERPDQPDALDLILQAQKERQEPPSAKRETKAQALYEQALRLDPASVRAMAGLATTILMRFARLNGSNTGPDLYRARDLIAAAEEIAPMDARVLWLRGEWLRVLQSWTEAEVAFDQVLTVYPHYDLAVEMLGVCEVQLGQSEDAIPLFREADPQRSSQSGHLGALFATGAGPAVHGEIR